MHHFVIILTLESLLFVSLQGVHILRRDKRKSEDVEDDISQYTPLIGEDESHLDRFLTPTVESSSGYSGSEEENWQRMYKRFVPKTIEEAEPIASGLTRYSSFSAVDKLRDYFTENHKQQNAYESKNIVMNDNLQNDVKNSDTLAHSEEKHFYSRYRDSNKDSVENRSRFIVGKQESSTIPDRIETMFKNTTSENKNNVSKVGTIERQRISSGGSSIEDVSLNNYDKILDLQDSSYHNSDSLKSEELDKSYDNLFSGSGSGSGVGANERKGDAENITVRQKRTDQGRSKTSMSGLKNFLLHISTSGEDEDGESEKSLITQEDDIGSSVSSGETDKYVALLRSSVQREEMSPQNELRFNSITLSNYKKSILSAVSDENEAEQKVIKKEPNAIHYDTTSKSSHTYQRNINTDSDSSASLENDKTQPAAAKGKELVNINEQYADNVTTDKRDKGPYPVTGNKFESVLKPDDFTKESLGVRKRSVDDNDYSLGSNGLKILDDSKARSILNEKERRLLGRIKDDGVYYDTKSKRFLISARSVEEPVTLGKQSSPDAKVVSTRKVEIKDDDPNADLIMAKDGEDDEQNDMTLKPLQDEDSNTIVAIDKPKSKRSVFKKVSDIVRTSVASLNPIKKIKISNSGENSTIQLDKPDKVTGYWTGLGSEPLFVTQSEVDHDGSGSKAVPHVNSIRGHPSDSTKGRIEKQTVDQGANRDRQIIGKKFVHDHNRSSLYKEMKSNYLLRNQRSLQKNRRMIKEPDRKYASSKGKAQIVLAFEDVQEMVPKVFHSYPEEDTPSFYLSKNERRGEEYGNKKIKSLHPKTTVTVRETFTPDVELTGRTLQNVLREKETKPMPKRRRNDIPTVHTAIMEYKMNKDEEGRGYEEMEDAEAVGEAKSFIHVKRAPNDNGYLGCFVDVLHPDRDLPVRAGIPFVTPNNCRSACKRTGYYYAGLQYGYLCFCGNTYGKYDMAPESECHHACSGDGNKTCGGYWRNAVFDTAGAPDEANEGPIPFYLPPKPKADTPEPKLVEEGQKTSSTASENSLNNTLSATIAPIPIPMKKENITPPSFFLEKNDKKTLVKDLNTQFSSLPSNAVKFIKIADITKNGTTILQPGAKLLAKSIIPHLSQIQLISTTPIFNQPLRGKEIINTDLEKKSVVPKPPVSYQGTGGQVMFSTPRLVLKAQENDETSKKQTVLMHWAYIHPHSRDEIVPTLMPHPTEPLKVQQDTRVFKGEIKLRQNWFDDFKDPTSPKYQILAGNVEQALKHIYDQDPTFLKASVLSFREGILNNNPNTLQKVVCEFALTFNQEAISPDAKVLEFIKTHDNKLDYMPIYSNSLKLSEYHFDPNNPMQPFRSPSNKSLANVRSQIPTLELSRDNKGTIGSLKPNVPANNNSNYPSLVQGTYAFNAVPQTQTSQSLQPQSQGMKELQSYLRAQNDQNHTNATGPTTFYAAGSAETVTHPVQNQSQNIPNVTEQKVEVPRNVGAQHVGQRKKVPYILRLFFWKDMLARKKRAAQQLASRQRLQRIKRQEVTDSDALQVPNTLPEGQHGKRRKKIKRKTKDLSVEKELRRSKRS